LYGKPKRGARKPGQEDSSDSEEEAGAKTRAVGVGNK
jgi:hypothetical protein